MGRNYGQDLRRNHAGGSGENRRVREAQFEAAGEKWPLAKNASQEEIIAVSNRMQVFDLSQRIEMALSKNGDQQR